MSLKGFEDITSDVSEDEIALAKWVAKCLLKRPAGKKNAATGKKICSAVLQNLGVKLTGIRMRKIIQYIRAYNLVPRLCSTQTGYFIAGNDQEWENWKISMRQRIRQQQYTLACTEYFGDGNNEKL